MKNYFFYNFDIEENEIYFPMATYNAFCKGNLSNDVVDIIGVFPDIPVEERAAYTGCYKAKEFVIFFPNIRSTKDILVYNTIQKNYFTLKSVKNMVASNWTVFEKNNYYYAVSVVGRIVLKLDLQKRVVETIMHSEFPEMDIYMDSAILRLGECVYIPYNHRKFMLIFDLEKEEFRKIDYPINLSHISSICYSSGLLWLTGEERKIYSWNMEENTANVVAEFPNNVQQYFADRVWFKHSFVYDNVLWLFPRSANVILKYNLLLNEFEQMTLPGEEEDGTHEEGRFVISKYENVKRCGDTVFFWSSKTRILYELDLLTNNIAKHSFFIKCSYKGKPYPLQKQGVLKEDRYINSLENLVSILKWN